MAEIDELVRSKALHPENLEFWKGVDDGKLLIGRCSGCAKVHYYPRVFCPHCYSQDVEWVPAVGRAQIYSFSIMRQANEAYVVAYVTLEEGLQVMTNIVDAEFDQLAIGLNVELTFGPAGGCERVPLFRPVIAGAV